MWTPLRSVEVRVRCRARLGDLATGDPGVWTIRWIKPSSVVSQAPATMSTAAFVFPTRPDLDATFAITLVLTMVGAVGCSASLPEARRPFDTAIVATGAVSELAAPLVQPDETPPPTDRQDRQLQVFGPTLLNPSSDIDVSTRRGAAEELIAMATPQSIDVLTQGLESGAAPVMTAIVGAVDAAPASRSRVSSNLRYRPFGGRRPRCSRCSGT